MLCRSLESCEKSDLILCNINGTLYAINGEAYERVVDPYEVTSQDVPVAEAASMSTVEIGIIGASDECRALYARKWEP